MNKVVCNICGTTYPENVSQCPICGFAHSSDSSNGNGERTYTHVPGGRFSKTNVRKRNQSVPKKASKPVPAPKPSKKKEDKTSAGLVIIIILLLLAIIAVVGYIALRFFLPNEYVFDGLDQLSISSLFQQKSSVPDDEVPENTEDLQNDADVQPEAEPVFCQDVVLDIPQFVCDSIGATYQIGYQLTPADAEEEVVFSSSDETVAIVDEFGLITVNGEGSAIITVSCGSASAECEVICTLAEEPVVITLNRKEITFTEEGESWLLYDGSVSADEIVWTSDDNNVAVIENGKVFAVGEGDATVYGFYDGQTVSCSIHCNFGDDDDSETTGKVSEASDNSDSSKTYKLYNPHGRSDDVTTKVGKEFKLRLIDQYKNTVDGAEWHVEDPDICSYENGVVKALSAGTTKVIATYNGKTYSCIVRVNKK